MPGLRLKKDTALTMAGTIAGPPAGRVSSPRPVPRPMPPIAARRVVPEQLSPGRLGDRRPPEHRVHRLREPALRVRVVGGEHEGILAERLDDVTQGLLALVQLDALEVPRPADVLARPVAERRDRVPAHHGVLVQTCGPERQ